MWPRWLRAAGCGLALAPVGCFLIPNPPTPIGGRGVLREAARAEHEVVFDTRLVEQPVGDPYLTRGLWAELTDPLPHQLTALLAANGLRVGVLNGRGPAEFEHLAGGEASVVAPTHRRGMIGKPKVVPVNGPLERCVAGVTDDLTDDPRRLDLSAVECGLLATATSAADGRLAVRCQFQLQHGEKRARWIPTADGGFDRSDERAREELPALTFEVHLAPGDTLVVGPTARPDGTLGAAYFHTADDSKVRVLAVQASAEK